MAHLVTVLPPSRVLRHWREQGRDADWIADRVRRYSRDWSRHQPASTHASSYRGRLPEPEILFQLYQTRTLCQVGQFIGATAEGVRYVLKRSGYPTSLHRGKKNHRRDVRTAEVVRLRTEDNLFLREIAVRLDCSIPTVKARLDEAGVNHDVWTAKRRPLGCPRCRTEPKARGLCNACYVRWWKRGKKENELPVDEGRRQHGR